MKNLVEYFQSAARNNAWSNMLLYEACAKLSPEEFAAERVSFFPSLPLTLNHILLVDLFYYGSLIDNGVDYTIFREEMPYPECGDLWREQKKMDQNLTGFCDSLDETKIQAEIGIRRKRGVIKETVAPTLTHLFLHQIHHRGQVHAMLAGTKVKPPQIDEFYLREDAELRLPDLNRLQIPWKNGNPLL